MTNKKKNDSKEFGARKYSDLLLLVCDWNNLIDLLPLRMLLEPTETSIW